MNDVHENAWQRLTRLAAKKSASEIINPDHLSFEAIATTFARLHPLPPITHAAQFSKTLRVKQ